MCTYVHAHTKNYCLSQRKNIDQISKYNAKKKKVSKRGTLMEKV